MVLQILESYRRLACPIAALTAGNLLSMGGARSCKRPTLGGSYTQGYSGNATLAAASAALQIDDIWNRCALLPGAAWPCNALLRMPLVNAGAHGIYVAQAPTLW
jgi:hypothetical protein